MASEHRATLNFSDMSISLGDGVSLCFLCQSRLSLYALFLYVLFSLPCRTASLAVVPRCPRSPPPPPGRSWAWTASVLCCAACTRGSAYCLGRTSYGQGLASVAAVRARRDQGTTTVSTGTRRRPTEGVVSWEFVTKWCFFLQF